MKRKDKWQSQIRIKGRIKESRKNVERDKQTNSDKEGQIGRRTERDKKANGQTD